MGPNPGSGPSSMLERLLSQENNIESLRLNLTHPRGFDTGSTFLNTVLVMDKVSSNSVSFAEIPQAGPSLRKLYLQFHGSLHLWCLPSVWGVTITTAPCNNHNNRSEEQLYLDSVSPAFVWMLLKFCWRWELKISQVTFTFTVSPT